MTDPPIRFADRPLPAWYDDAKLGIFIHWTAASIPAFAPVGPSPFELAEASPDWSLAFRNSPYVEWYQNSLAIEGSPVAEHHRQRYGDTPYDAFVHRFAAGLDGWDPAAWGALFERAGARYVVLVTKHHDGFCLWPTAHPNPHREGWASRRDVVGELGAEVRRRGLRYGLYYSGGLDWTFSPPPITTFADMLARIPTDEGYAAYARAQVTELVERYRPDVLWNDIAWPPRSDPEEVFAHYYAHVPDGVVNDRFDLPRQRSGGLHTDFTTPEYSTTPPGTGKWEVCRGIGTSFGYNAEEGDADLLGADELVRLFVDIVARGGNLLLNVGPAADGTIPWAQAQRLLALGWWLEVHGEAIYGTRPWARARGWTLDALPVRFTYRDPYLYAVLLGTPRLDTVTILGVRPAAGSEVHLLGHRAPLAWEQVGDDVRVQLPGVLADAPAHALRFTP